MSVKPVAWMDEHGCTCNDDEKVVRGPGFDIPLYSAPAPELAEALQRMVDAESESALWELIETARELLARITPK